MRRKKSSLQVGAFSLQECEEKEIVSLTYTCPTGGRTVYPDGRTKPEVSFNELS